MDVCRCMWMMVRKERKNEKREVGVIFIPVTCRWLGVDNRNV